MCVTLPASDPPNKVVPVAGGYAIYFEPAKTWFDVRGNFCDDAKARRVFQSRVSAWLVAKAQDFRRRKLRAAQIETYEAIHPDHRITLVETYDGIALQRADGRWWIETTPYGSLKGRFGNPVWDHNYKAVIAGRFTRDQRRVVFPSARLAQIAANKLMLDLDVERERRQDEARFVERKVTA